MIPKIIHYCWFGGKPLSKEYQNYIATWRKYCSDYEIKEWNENNFDINENMYCREAYETKNWAFVSDYARLKIIYQYGGIYLDTDVELIEDLTPLINAGVGFLGFQNQEEVNTGLGFAAEPYNNCVKKMLDMYANRHFLLENGRVDQTPCPVINTVALKMCGLKTGRRASKTVQILDGIRVYPIDYFNPLNPDTMKLKITQNTVMIHHYSATWYDKKQVNRKKIKRIFPNWLLKIRTIYISKKQICKMEEKL